MIQNDKQLAVEQEALACLERALESLRERVLPKNPRNYETFAEGYLDEINTLRRQIDAYLAQKAARIPAANSSATTSGSHPTSLT